MAQKTRLKTKRGADTTVPAFLKPENRPVQYFSQEYIDQCQKMSLKEIIEKVDQQQQFFWKMHLEENFDQSVLISLKVPKNLLQKFKQVAEENNLKYQTQIKNLMQDWLLKTLG